MQNSSANEASEHNHERNWRNLSVVTVGEKLIESHDNQSELKNEGQEHMHENVDSLLLFDLSDSLLDKLLSFRVEIDI